MNGNTQLHESNRILLSLSKVFYNKIDDNKIIAVDVRKKSSMVSYPGSLAQVLEVDLSFGSPNFSRPRRENWQADFIFDSVTLPNVLLIVYAPGPGPAVGLLNGCLELVLNPISASLV